MGGRGFGESHGWVEVCAKGKLVCVCAWCVCYVCVVRAAQAKEMLCCVITYARVIAK